MSYRQYLTRCNACGNSTSKQYAREHNGKCKACAEEGTTQGARCPDCGGPIERWKLAKGYHCSRCTREADPQGYINEVMGYTD
jgi:zinc-ribbons